jgi:hypothetical protein
VRAAVLSGLNVENSAFGYTETALITSGLFCVCSRVEYVYFSAEDEKCSKIILHQRDMCIKIE